ncbi:hypothetical protein JOF53_003768 [Crossiella equi]|uniref:Uncharacterized protein n=1 Tax=Crossiella equi TaxID=130796 RepID=A0ABS5AE78_9PSEU|nr:hypothetical protein [Crossiella equi]MBP2474896.1 hypothetical protein [Crossiella equi]
MEEIFGEVLPESTSDDRPSTKSRTTDDDWFLENRPPHHGG